MTPANYDLVITSGATVAPDQTFFVYKVDTTPVNLTGAEVVVTLRDGAGGTIFEWTTANGKVALTPLLGKIGLNLSADDTLALVQYAPSGATKMLNSVPLYRVASWTLDVHPGGGAVDRLLQGAVLITRG